MLPHDDAARQQVHRVCQDIITDLMGLENAFYFFRPVHPEEDGAPDYFRVVVRPMCILDIQENLDKDKYDSFDAFASDMRQIWENAEIFNKPSHLIHRAAVRLAQRFEQLTASLPHGLTEDEQKSALQRLVELRFKNYRMNKKSHQ
jgi:chromatin structure-remodeling complex subunit RSC1/2